MRPGQECAAIKWKRIRQTKYTTNNAVKVHSCFTQHIRSIKITASCFCGSLTSGAVNKPAKCEYQHSAFVTANRCEDMFNPFPR